jgi:hypothetical protein
MADDINVTIAEEIIAVTMTGGDTWDGISGKPAAVAESSFIVSGPTPFSWLRKTLAQVKTILGLGSAAYTESTVYASASHNHVVGDITDIGSIANYDFWSGTEAEYTALGVYDSGTLYFTTA